MKDAPTLEVAPAPPMAVRAIVNETPTDLVALSLVVAEPDLLNRENESALTPDISQSRFDWLELLLPGTR